MPLPEHAYVRSLLADLDQELPGVWGRRLGSVFIGGGTPSLLSPESVDSLISGIRARLPSVPDMEITLEANPGSSDAQKFREFRSAGITRLSIGVQSFDDSSLSRIGRVHDARDARRAVSAALDAGFGNFNLDLMYGLPGQSLDMAAGDVEQALAFDPPHLSCYQLTVEPNTPFSAHPPPLPDDDSIWEMQVRLENAVEDRGLGNYEVSAFASAGRQCRHNLNYWLFGDYLGIGAGAHGKLTLQGRIKRTWKLKNPKRYMDSAGTAARIGGERELSREEAGFEFMLNALRLRQPVTAPLFRERTGTTLDRFGPALAKAREGGLLDYDGFSVSTTGRGRRFLNELLQLFVP